MPTKRKEANTSCRKVGRVSARSTLTLVLNNTSITAWTPFQCPPAAAPGMAALWLRSRFLYSSNVPWKGVTLPPSHIHSSSTVDSIKYWSCDTCLFVLLGEISECDGVKKCEGGVYVMKGDVEVRLEYACEAAETLCDGWYQLAQGPLTHSFSLSHTKSHSTTLYTSLTHHQHPALEHGQSLNECINSINVKVVGGLVKQQDVRLCKRQLRCWDGEGVFGRWKTAPHV